MSNWVAISYGALVLNDLPSSGNKAQLVALPTLPSEPISLLASGARLWRRLIKEGVVADADLSSDERQILSEMSTVGLVSNQPEHAARVRHLNTPWLSSPMHELVYALVASVARDRSIDSVFLKGPILFAQGLRIHEHSGDVDVWVEPSRINEFISELEHWGWSRQFSPWDGTNVRHSITMSPTNSWGCEIDIHRRMPGVGIGDIEAFHVVQSNASKWSFAGIDGLAPDRDMNAVLNALHAIRPRAGEEVPTSAENVATEMLRSTGKHSALRALEIGAQRALRTPLDLAFPDLKIEWSSAPSPREWKWRRQASPLQAHLSILRDLSWPERIRSAWRLLFPPAEHIRHAETTRGVRSRTLLAARLRRFWRAISSALRASHANDE